MWKQETYEMEKFRRSKNIKKENEVIYEIEYTDIAKYLDYFKILNIYFRLVLSPYMS